jgi:hypothetical protein
MFSQDNLAMTFISFTRQARRQAQTLFNSQPTTAPAIITEEQVRHLPDPVQRFLRYTRVIGTPQTRTVRLKQSGTFRASEKPDARWYPLRAEQYFTTQPPNFVWLGRIRLAPLLSIQGLAAFHGYGRLQIKLMGLLKVADYHGPQADQAELVRYLSEIIWFPAICLQPELRWGPLDDCAARATLNCQSLTVSGDFHFDAQGALTDFVAQRERDIDGQPGVVTWSTHVSNYRAYGDLYLASTGEAAWHLPWGKFPYVRLNVTELEHNVVVVYAA